MPATLDRLQKEHRDIATLLDILENELSSFDEAAAPDFEIMAAIADYFLGYPQAAHHPKEDLVYRALIRRQPDCAAAVGDIEAEHVSIGELAGLFAKAVNNVMQDAEVSREAFDHVVRRFIDAQRAHIDKEEGGLFRIAADALSDEDWAEIDKRIGDDDDPLFGAIPEERFATLRKDIVDWENERQSAS